MNLEEGLLKEVLRYLIVARDLAAVGVDTLRVPTVENSKCSLSTGFVARQLPEEFEVSCLIDVRSALFIHRFYRHVGVLPSYLVI